MRLGQTVVIVYVSKLFASVIGFVATVYFARVLGAEVLGYYFLILALVLWLGIVGKMGVAGAIAKRISEEEEPFVYLTAGGITIASIGGVLALLILAAGPYINDYVGTDAALYVAALVLARLFYEFVSSALKGQHLVHISGILSPVKIGGRSLIQVGLVVAGFGLFGMVVGYAIGSLLVGLLGLFFLTIRIRQPTLRHFRSLFDFAKFAWLGSVRVRAYNQSDVLVLGLFVPSAVVGIYSVAWSVATFLGLFGASVSQSMFPEISKVSTEHDSEAVRDLVSNAIGYAGLVIIPGVVGGALLGDRLLRIYGSTFADGATVLWILVAAVLLFGYLEQCLNALNAIDRPDLAFRVNAVFIPTNVVLNVLLIWRFEMLGAAVATFLSTLLGLAIAYIILSSLVTFPFPTTPLTRQTIAALIMGVAVYLARAALEPGVSENFALVLGLTTFGAAVYFGVLFAILPDFRGLIYRNLPAAVADHVRS